MRHGTVETWANPRMTGSSSWREMCEEGIRERKGCGFQMRRESHIRLHRSQELAHGGLHYHLHHQDAKWSKERTRKPSLMNVLPTGGSLHGLTLPVFLAGLCFLDFIFCHSTRQELSLARTPWVSSRQHPSRELRFLPPLLC